MNPNEIYGISDEEFKKLSRFIKVQSGICIRNEKKNMIVSRLQKELSQKGFSNFSEYYEYLAREVSGEAIKELINCITTNYTFFMRESMHFEIYKQIVLPYLKSKCRNHDIRTWCAASSTGEEAYTLAFILDEFLGAEKTAWNTKILATDISSQALEQAKRGVYSKNSLESLPQNWKNHYFVPKGVEDMEVHPRLKQEVIFRRFNLTDEIFPFKKKFHTIFCRNVMIYFDEETKNKLIDQLYENLEVGGFLFVGHTEVVRDTQERFEYMGPSVYRKI